MAATALTEDLTLDITHSGSLEDAKNVLFEYTRFGKVTPMQGTLHTIPEPTTMMLLTSRGLLVIPRRRRCA